jgi:hypothetical protein
VVATFGRALTLRHVTTGEYVPEDGGVAGDSTSDESVTGTVGRYSKSEIGDTIRVEDIPVLIAAKGLTSVPTTADRLVIDTKVYEIVSIEPIYSGEEVAAYRLQARR